MDVGAPAVKRMAGFCEGPHKDVKNRRRFGLAGKIVGQHLPETTNRRFQERERPHENFPEKRDWVFQDRVLGRIIPTLESRRF